MANTVRLRHLKIVETRTNPIIFIKIPKNKRVIEITTGAQALPLR